MLISNPRGNFRFLPGIEPYSSGVVADPGFEIVHVTLLRPLPYREGFDQIAAVLQTAGRPRQGLCAVELRSPTAFSRAGFVEFNRGYRELLDAWDIPVDGQNPVARTNVAPAWAAPDEPSLFGFSYTLPAAEGTPPTFVVAGAGELRGGPLESAQVIRPGETSHEAMLEKASYVMHAIGKRLAGLGISWDDVTITNVYTVQNLDGIIGPAVLEVLGSSAIHGIRWYHARPPIAELEYEMDARGVRVETYLG
jgi:hypothetical protein